MTSLEDTNSTKAASGGVWRLGSSQFHFQPFSFPFFFFPTGVGSRPLPHRFNSIWRGKEARFFNSTCEDILIPRPFFGVGASFIRVGWWSVGSMLHEIKSN